MNTISCYEEMDLVSPWEALTIRSRQLIVMAWHAPCCIIPAVPLPIDAAYVFGACHRHALGRRLDKDLAFEVYSHQLTIATQQRTSVTLSTVAKRRSYNRRCRKPVGPSHMCHRLFGHGGDCCRKRHDERDARAAVRPSNACPDPSHY